MKDLQAARMLGYASLGIAAAEALGQGYVEEELLGIDEHPALMRGLAAREAASGITILTQNKITPTLIAGLWSRVAGDMIDGALLAMAGAKTRKPAAFATTCALVGGIVAADLYYAFRLTRRLAMSKVDVKQAAALDDKTSPAAQPPTDAEHVPMRRIADAPIGS